MRFKALLNRIVFGAALALVALTTIPYGSVEYHWQGFFCAAAFALAALWVVEGALEGDWLAREHVLVLPLAALAGFALLQTLPLFSGSALSFDPYETRLTALRLLALACALAIFLRYTRTEGRLRALVYTVVAAGLLSSVFGIVRQTMQRGEGGFLLAYLSAGSGYAQFVNKNHFAYLAEMALGLVLGIVAGGGAGRGRSLAHLAIALPVWAALVLSNSRGGVFAVLCQLIFLAAAFGIVRRGVDVERYEEDSREEDGSRFARLASSHAARVGLAIVLLVVVVVGMMWLGGEPLAERMGSVGQEVAAEGEDTTRAGRAAIWRATWEMFAAHPLAGVGLGAYWTAVPSFHAGSGGLVPQQAHNDYLELLASAGVVGAALLVAFVVMFARRAGARLREGSDFARSCALGALTGLVGVAVHSLVEFGLHVTANALVAVALVAVAAARVRGHSGEADSIK